LTPRASTRVQIISAAIVWLIGASILLVRGALFLQDRWIPLLIAVAVVVGLAKERYILREYARKAVMRIHDRGRACYFGFFSVKAWLFVLVMMGGGIALRRVVLADSRNVVPWVLDVLAVVYIAVGTALVFGDRVYWHAVFKRAPGYASLQPPQKDDEA